MVLGEEVAGELDGWSFTTGVKDGNPPLLGTATPYLPWRDGPGLGILVEDLAHATVGHSELATYLARSLRSHITVNPSLLV